MVQESFGPFGPKNLKSKKRFPGSLGPRMKKAEKSQQKVEKVEKRLFLTRFWHFFSIFFRLFGGFRARRARMTPVRGQEDCNETSSFLGNPVVQTCHPEKSPQRHDNSTHLLITSRQNHWKVRLLSIIWRTKGTGETSIQRSGRPNTGKMDNPKFLDQLQAGLWVLSSLALFGPETSCINVD